jgi:hypothetical protein
MVRAFAEQVQIEIGKDAAVAVRIVDLERLAAGIRDDEAVVTAVGDTRLIQALVIDPRHRHELASGCAHRDCRRRRMKGAHDVPSARIFMRTQMRERVRLDDLKIQRCGGQIYFSMIAVLM